MRAATGSLDGFASESVTVRARMVINQLREAHGPLIFHLSGGCCDGFAPTRFAQSDFVIASQDILPGKIHSCPFYMSPDQYQYCQNMHLTFDIAEGRGSNFSLEIPLGCRFNSCSVVFHWQRT